MRLVRSLSLSRKLALSYGALTALLVGLSTLALVQMETLNATLGRVASNSVVRGQAIRDMERRANEFAASLKGLSGVSLEELSKTYSTAVEATKGYEAAAARARQLATEPSVAQLLQASSTSASAATEIIELSRKENAGRGEAAAAFSARMRISSELPEWDKRIQTWLQALHRLSDWNDATSSSSAEAAVKGASLTRAILVGGVGFAVVLAALLGIAMTRSISKGLRTAVQAADRMAGHDLSVKIPTDRKDEIGSVLQALESMRARQHDLASGVRSASTSIHEASSEITAGGHDLSVRTERTAAVLQESLSAMSELSRAIDQASNAADEARRLAEETDALARTGNEVAAGAARAMGEVNASAQRIGEIVGLIDGISSQTNILALNAAVEAARAGEHGKGFAVVASEVRALAQRSAAAALEIKGLIESALEKLAAGLEQVQRAGTSTSDIRTAVARVMPVVQEISLSTTQERAAVARGSDGLSRLDGVAQQNAALAEQSAAASASLMQMARDLTEMVKNFKLDHDDSA